MNYLTSILVVGLAVSPLAGASETAPNRKAGPANHHDGHHSGHSRRGHHGGGNGDDCERDHPGHGHPKPPEPPPAPTQLTAEAVSEFQVNLNWSDTATNELGFKIERSRDGTNYLQIARLLPNVTSYPDTGLMPDTKYFYRAQAFNQAGNSPYSNVARTQTFAPAGGLALVKPETAVGEGGPMTGDATAPNQLTAVATSLTSTRETLKLLSPNPPVWLQTRALGNGGMCISWTGPAAGVLETSPNLAPDSWSPAGAATQQPDGSWQLDVAPDGPMRFYRFRSP